MVIHVISALPVPKGVLRRIEKRFAAFIWDAGGDKRRHWISFDKMCRPYGCGGLNLCRLQDMKKSMQAKLAWKRLQRDSVWAEFISRKYRANGARRKSGLWKEL
uniref:Uncharacterized protein n=1 Tax=Kalanchoe fedtschenkoi TaxID=63787 RepID=A0A7N0VLC2_KALFE